MPRVKGGFKSHRRHKKVLKKTKGFYAGRRSLIRRASEALDRSWQSAFVGRKDKKIAFRGLWQTRLAAAAKAHGWSYSRLLGSLKKKSVALNRKILSELSINHPQDFSAIIEWAKK